eukprot:gene9927-10977_t
MEEEDDELVTTREVGLPSRLRIITVFSLWWEELEHVLYSNTDRAIVCLHCLARIMDDCFAIEEEVWERKDSHPDEFPIVNRLVGVILNDFLDVAESSFQMIASITNTAYLKAMLRLMVAIKQACWKTGDDFHVIFPQDSLEGFLSEQAATATQSSLSDPLLEARLAFLAGELVEDTNVDLPFPALPLIERAIQKFKESKEEIERSVEQLVDVVRLQRERAAYIKDSNLPILTPDIVSPEEIANWSRDQEDSAQSIEHHLLVASGNLRFLAATADYTEALHPSIEAHLIDACLDLLSFPHFPLQLFSLGWFVSALAHKKVASELVEKRGIPLIIGLANTLESHPPFYNLLLPYASFILAALSKHTQPMEALVTDIVFAEELLRFACKLFRADSMDAKLNIVEWFGEIFGHPLLLLASQKVGVIPLIAWQMKKLLGSEAAEEKNNPMRPAFFKEAVRSLLKYIGINLYWNAQHCKRSILERQEGQGFLSGNVIKVDENQLNALEMTVLTHMAMNNAQLLPTMKADLLNRFRDNFPSLKVEPVQQNGETPLTFYDELASFFPRKYDDDNVSVLSQVRNVSPDWIVAKQFIEYDIIALLLLLINNESKDCSMQLFCLQTLQLLCLDSAAIVELQHCIPHSVLHNFRLSEMENMKKGLEILLSLLTPNVRRDPNVIGATLRVLSAMCTPPHYRYNGDSFSKAERFLSENYHRKQVEHQANSSNALLASTVKKKMEYYSTKKIGFLRDIVPSKLDAVQSHARIAVRAYAGINSLVHLISFRRNQLHAQAVRLETIKVLIGIAHDKEICQILAKMRVETIISNQLRNEVGQSAWGENSQSIGPPSNLLALYCHILSEAIDSHVEVSERHLDATQEALTRKAVVDKSHIDFDEEELMELIKEHLLTKGLHQTAQALQEELALRKPHQPHECPGPVQPLGVDGPLQTPLAPTLIISSRKRHRGDSPEPIGEEQTGKKLHRRLSHELPPMPAEMQTIPLSRSNSLQLTTSVGSTGSSSTAIGGTAVNSCVPLSRYQRSKNILRAVKESSFGGLDELASTTQHHKKITSHGIMSPEPTSKSITSSTATKAVKYEATIKTSKLSGIMHRYLKLQHSQCKHPVATLPLMSLQKPHVCPRPPQQARHNIYSLVQPLFSLVNTQWYNYSRRDDNLQLLRYIYSSYRSVRYVRFVDQESPLTSSAFAADSLHLWLGSSPSWNSDGPGIALMNYLSGVQELTIPQDLDGEDYISRIRLTPPTASNPCILLSVANQNTNRSGEHKLYLWKDRGGLDTFESRFQHQFHLDSPSSGEIEPYDITQFWEESFSSSGNSLAVVYSTDSDVDLSLDSSMLAAVFDCNTGAIVHTLGDLSSPFTYELPSVRFVGEDDRLLLFDGRLWDLRMSQCAHRFDKLSEMGCTSVHPNKPEVIIDSSVWDLRNFNLVQTVPQLDRCNVEFNPTHDVLFAHRVMSVNEPMNNHVEYNYFHVLDSKNYQHMHTEIVDKEDFVVGELQVDRQGLGYMSVFAGSRQSQDTTGSMKCQLELNKHDIFELHPENAIK